MFGCGGYVQWGFAEVSCLCHHHSMPVLMQMLMQVCQEADAYGRLDSKPEESAGKVRRVSQTLLSAAGRQPNLQQQ